jgi:perosamine synthetase
MSNGPISISSVSLEPEVETLVLQVLRSGQLAQGPMVSHLERQFERLVDVRHAVAVANGTLALVAAMQAIRLMPGDEVITSPFTFIATTNAALEAGAHVRFADISLDDFNIDVDAVASMIRSETRVLLPVHLYGQPADCGELTKVADAHDVALLEDAAQAHGATFDGRPVGSFGVGCFSLYATKNVTTGEGGIVTTNDDDIADRLRLLRNQGMRARYEYEIAGHNYRMTDLQAAVGIPQVEGIEATTARRERNAQLLTDGLTGIEGLILPRVLPKRRHVFHQYTVRLTADARISRDQLASQLAARDIGTGVYYPKTVLDYECYRDHPLIDRSSVPNAEQAAREVLSLPVHSSLTEADVERIIEEVRKLLT